MLPFGSAKWSVPKAIDGSPHNDDDDDVDDGRRFVLALNRFSAERLKLLLTIDNSRFRGIGSPLIEM